MLLAAPLLSGRLFLIHLGVSASHYPEGLCGSWQVLLSVLELRLLTYLAGVGCHLAVTEEDHGVTVLCEQIPSCCQAACSSCVIRCEKAQVLIQILKTCVFITLLCELSY